MGKRRFIHKMGSAKGGDIMKIYKFALIIFLVLFMGLTFGCDSDSVARNGAADCPGTNLLPINSPTEFKREYFRRNSRLGEPACVSKDLVGIILGVNVTLGDIKKDMKKMDNRLGVKGRDIIFTGDHKGLEKILITGQSKNYTGLYWKNAFSVVQQIGFPANFSSTKKATELVYQLLVFKKPKTSDNPVLLGSWDSAFEFLELLYSDNAPFISDEVREIIKTTPFASPKDPSTGIPDPGGGEPSLSGCPREESSEQLGEACPFGCPSFFIANAAPDTSLPWFQAESEPCNKDWLEALEFIINGDNKCNPFLTDGSNPPGGRNDCRAVLQRFLEGGPYECEPGDTPQACKGALRVRAFFLVVNDFNPKYTGNGFTATGYSNLLSYTNNEFFIKNQSIEDIELATGDPVEEIFFCINGVQLPEDPPDYQTCKCSGETDSLGFCPSRI